MSFLQGTWLIGNGFSTFRLAAAGLSAGRQEYGSAFLTMPIDGIVGLGFQELVNVNGKALMETLVEETPSGCTRCWKWIRLEDQKMWIRRLGNQKKLEM
jgi:hypothetical protein